MIHNVLYALHLWFWEACKIGQNGGQMGRTGSPLGRIGQNGFPVGQNGFRIGQKRGGANGAIGENMFIAAGRAGTLPVALETRPRVPMFIGIPHACAAQS
jgi:hypothetical protein